MEALELIPLLIRAGVGVAIASAAVGLYWWNSWAMKNFFDKMEHLRDDDE